MNCSIPDCKNRSASVYASKDAEGKRILIGFCNVQEGHKPTEEKWIGWAEWFRAEGLSAPSSPVHVQKP